LAVSTNHCGKKQVISGKGKGDILFILKPSSIQTWENVQNISIKHTRNDIDE
jgi:hypothetical protein